MGVRGLTTFIGRSPDRFLKKITLKDTLLVVDGNCVASHLYKLFTKRDSAFGGDYDEYYALVHRFFSLLKKCQIIPIVLFDGGYEDKKLPTVLSRLKKKLHTLKVSFSRGFSNMKFFPIFMRQVFTDVLRVLHITQIQCEFEADGEIAALARVLQCPVLSYDSDFYIYDVLYIPFTTIDMELTSEDEEFGLPCLIYDVEEFLKEYPGLTKYHLPLVATLLGNDFVSGHLFKKFFEQIPLSKSKSCSLLEKKIAGLLKWTSYQTEKSVLHQLSCVMKKEHYSKFLKALEETKENYSVECCCNVEVIDSGRVTVTPPSYQLPISSAIIKQLADCELPSFIINLAALRKYFLPLQVEDLEKKSSHDLATPIIMSIDKIICEETGDTSSLCFYKRNKRIWKTESIAPKGMNTQCLYECLDFSQSDQDCVKSFHPDSQLFIACFIYWCKAGSPNVFHAYSLLLGYLACQAKDRVGYFRTGKHGNFEEKEINIIADHFGPYRKTSESCRSFYRVQIVHGFNVFQSILYHASVLNTMLGCQLAPCRVSNSFSGTLFYNLYGMLDQKNVMKTLERFLGSTGKIWPLFEELCEKLIRYLPENFAPSREVDGLDIKRRKRKKRKKRQDARVEESSNEGDLKSDEDECYNDVSNQFSLLRA